MNQTTFGKTGLKVSRLGFGGAPIGYLATDRQRVGEILKILLDSGVNLIDTAASYHGSEEAIGQLVGSRRSEFVLVSKVGGQQPDFEDPAWSRALILKTVERSLRRLNTNYIDVMLLHTCDLATLKKGEALGALEECVKAGKIRFIGYSGDNDAVAYASTLPQVSVVQTSISIADQINIDGLLPLAWTHNVGVMAKRPIANAAWRKPTEQQGFYGNYASTYHTRLEKMDLNPTELGFHGPANLTWPEIALRFTLSIPGINVAIIGTTNPDNARANIVQVEKGPLPAQAIRRIRDAFNAAQAEEDQPWAGQG